jgi:hypothetical protein
LAGGKAVGILSVEKKIAWPNAGILYYCEDRRWQHGYSDAGRWYWEYLAYAF